MQIRAWVDDATNAIGLSLYNFLNILNINQILTIQPLPGEQWLESIVKQTGFNPYDHDPRERTPPKLALAS